jgi:hypothetical protein
MRSVHETLTTDETGTLARATILVAVAALWRYLNEGTQMEPEPEALCDTTAAMPPDDAGSVSL